MIDEEKQLRTDLPVAVTAERYKDGWRFFAVYADRPSRMIIRAYSRTRYAYAGRLPDSWGRRLDWKMSKTYAGASRDAWRRDALNVYSIQYIGE